MVSARFMLLLRCWLVLLLLLWWLLLLLRLRLRGLLLPLLCWLVMPAANNGRAALSFFNSTIESRAAVRAKAICSSDLLS
jgi:hypothetical protein